MDSYSILIKKSALKELHKFPKKEVVRIVKRITYLSKNPRPTDCKKLKGFANLWRVRIGNYRVVYRIQDQELIVEILEVVNRKDAYKR